MEWVLVGLAACYALVSTLWVARAIWHSNFRLDWWVFPWFGLGLLTLIATVALSTGRALPYMAWVVVLAVMYVITSTQAGGRHQYPWWHGTYATASLLFRIFAILGAIGLFGLRHERRRAGSDKRV